MDQAEHALRHSQGRFAIKQDRLIGDERPIFKGSGILFAPHAARNALALHAAQNALVRSASIVMLCLGASGAAAQSGFGDTDISYDRGIVYDDDLVPGRSVNQPYIVDDETLLEPDDERVREPSPNLIGADGRSRRPPATK